MQIALITKTWALWSSMQIDSVAISRCSLGLIWQEMGLLLFWSDGGLCLEESRVRTKSFCPWLVGLTSCIFPVLQIKKAEMDRKTLDWEIVELTNKLLDAKTTINKLEELNVSNLLFGQRIQCKQTEWEPIGAECLEEDLAAGKNWDASPIYHKGSSFDGRAIAQHVLSAEASSFRL